MHIYRTAESNTHAYVHTHTQPHQQESVRGLTACVFDDHPVVLTGGTDRIVRLWNLRDADRCSCVVKPKYLKRVQFDYQYVPLPLSVTLTLCTCMLMHSPLPFSI